MDGATRSATIADLLRTAAEALDLLRRERVLTLTPSPGLRSGADRPSRPSPRRLLHPRARGVAIPGVGEQGHHGAARVAAGSPSATTPCEIY